MLVSRLVFLWVDTLVMKWGLWKELLLVEKLVEMMATMKADHLVYVLELLTVH
jgi:hypothetical protein